jgi:AraC family transcriptional regulator
MQVLGHGSESYSSKVGCVLLSSANRRWRGLSAELRFHAATKIPAHTPSFTEIAVQIRGTTAMLRQAGGVWQHIVSFPGVISLCPAGVREDFAYISNDIEEMLHIYLSPSPFAALARHTSQDFTSESVRYEAGFRDLLIEQIAAEILSELRHETSCGNLLVETLADGLAVRLLNNYSSLSAVPLRVSHRSGTLDSRRLQRVIGYIHANLTNEITVEELAAVAALSRFHFSRIFKATTGQSPSHFIGRLRLDLAKSLLVKGRSIAEVAYDCRFSSASNFARSFRRATGLTPAQHRLVDSG